MNTTPESLHSLLLALGLSQNNPTPPLHKFPDADPMGEGMCRNDREYRELFENIGGIIIRREEELEDDSVMSISKECEDLVSQAIKLQNMEETLTSLLRLTGAIQTLVARRITMLVIASLSTDSSLNFVEIMRSLGLANILYLVRLLRLVHAGRIDGTPGKLFGVSTPSSLLPIKGLDCLSSAITCVVTDSLKAGSQLMQSCSHDLLAAAVGGTKLLQRPRKQWQESQKKKEKEVTDEPREKSDVAVLLNPSFFVTQSLVQTMAEAAGKALFSGDAGVLLMTDALAACLFSSKLESHYRFWALEQLLKVFATSSSSRDSTAVPQPEGQSLSHSQRKTHYTYIVVDSIHIHTCTYMYNICMNTFDSYPC